MEEVSENEKDIKPQGPELVVVGSWVDTCEIEQLCRACASSSTTLIKLFEDEGVQHDLAVKFNKHLPIKVAKDDKLPKNMCYTCASTLISFHDLVKKCLDSDIKLKSLLNRASDNSKNLDDDDDDDEIYEQCVEDTYDEDDDADQNPEDSNDFIAPEVPNKNVIAETIACRSSSGTLPIMKSNVVHTDLTEEILEGNDNDVDMSTDPLDLNESTEIIEPDPAVPSTSKAFIVEVPTTETDTSKRSVNLLRKPLNESGGEKHHQNDINVKAPVKEDSEFKTFVVEHKFICLYCPNTFSESCSLSEHLKIKHPHNILPCSLCGQEFSNKTDLFNHHKECPEMLLEEGETTLEKPEIKKERKQPVLQLIDMSSSSKCKKIPITSMDASELRTALETVESVEVIEYLPEPPKFKRIDDNEEIVDCINPLDKGNPNIYATTVDILHNAGDVVGDKLICRACKKNFTSEGSLRRHFRQQHLKGNMRNEVALSRQLQLKRVNDEFDPVFESSQGIVSDETFAKVNVIVVHVDVTADNKVICKICGRSFARQTVFRRHVRTVHLLGDMTQKVVVISHPVQKKDDSRKENLQEKKSEFDQKKRLNKEGFVTTIKKEPNLQIPVVEHTNILQSNIDCNPNTSVMSVDDNDDDNDDSNSYDTFNGKVKCRACGNLFSHVKAFKEHRCRSHLNRNSSNNINNAIRELRRICTKEELAVASITEKPSEDIEMMDELSITNFDSTTGAHNEDGKDTPVVVVNVDVTSNNKLLCGFCGRIFVLKSQIRKHIHAQHLRRNRGQKIKLVLSRPYKRNCAVKRKPAIIRDKSKNSEIVESKFNDDTNDDENDDDDDDEAVIELYDDSSENEDLEEAPK